MNEDTRNLVLHIQGQDLAALWAAGNGAEIDATMRVYHRQLDLLDRQLKTPQSQDLPDLPMPGAPDTTTNTLEDSPIQMPILTEDGDVHQPGVDYSSKPFFAMPAPLPIDAASADLPLEPHSRPPVQLFAPAQQHSRFGFRGPTSQFIGRPVVRLPPLTSSQRSVQHCTAPESGLKRSAEHLTSSGAPQPNKHPRVHIKTEPVSESNHIDLTGTRFRLNVRNTPDNILPPKAVSDSENQLHTLPTAPSNTTFKIF